ncbi:MAG TPA: hypothetical protein VLE53_10685 [Gemmatimonadaceae bacterium]|nr:hypothetical protein [Gemmatimonadaceae bacterium]
MSRAFTNEDQDEGGRARQRFDLPAPDDPAFDEAAARALLEAARDGITGDAEAATGYYWGEERLKPHMARLLAEAEAAGDERGSQLARRFLK